jgi:hypothetical protein
MHVSSRDAPQSLEFWEDGRQPGHYTRFGVTSGWPVTREYSPSHLSDYTANWKVIHRKSVNTAAFIGTYLGGVGGYPAPAQLCGNL